MKEPKIFICQNCGAEFLKWSGKCEKCGDWNTLKENIVKEQISRGFGIKQAKVLEPISFAKIKGEDFSRLMSGVGEFDRVLGGGIVSGSVILLGGDPGIGKSTLILQVLDKIKLPILYVSGEESAEQIKMRADRLSIKSSSLEFLAETNIDNIVATIEKTKPRLAIIDSIQTMYSSDVPNNAGSIAQVREAAIKLIELAKTKKIALVLIGHVTKEGAVAGPRILEHLVDAVLYLEGDRYHSFRILRGVKNRFGSTNEAGVFEMKGQGLLEVKNPSGLFLEERKAGEPGSAVAATLEGTRAFLIEIQALTSVTNFGYPRRTASGFDFNRMQLLIAVLTKKAGLRLDNQDVYLNLTGGFKISEPAVDLAVCLAIASAYSKKPCNPDMVAVGEVGLTGEIRSVSQLEKRISEAEKLGFKRMLVPSSLGQIKSGCQLIKVNTIQEAVAKAM